jgi:hypothetical protein
MAFNNVVPGNTWNYTYSDYTPYGLPIIGITNAQNAVVDFGTAHPYTAGEFLSFRVSKPYGMIEINNLQGRVLAITSTTVTMEIDTLSFTPFVYPPVGVVEVPAQVVPAGSGIIPGQYTPTVNLEDAFDNRQLT